MSGDESPSRLREGFGVGLSDSAAPGGQAHPRPHPQAGGEKLINPSNVSVLMLMCGQTMVWPGASPVIGKLISVRWLYCSCIE